MKKIVSLLPSATEMVCALGLGDNLVGVSHECDFPPPVASLPKVTETLIGKNASSSEIDAQVRERLQTAKALYSLNRDKLIELKPDIIVTQALCDVCAVAYEDVENSLSYLSGNPEIINLEPQSLNEVLESVLLLGRACDCERSAARLVGEFESRIAAVAERTRTQITAADRPKVVFLEWIDPPFGPGHWMSELIDLAGGIDCLGSRNQPSRAVDWQTIIDARPDLIFIACCGYSEARAIEDIPILEELDGWHQLPCVKNNEVYVSDGNAYFSRPGPRLTDSLEILAHTFHPELHPLPGNLRRAYGHARKLQ